MRSDTFTRRSELDQRMDRLRLSRPPSLVFWITWHGLATVALALIPTLLVRRAAVWDVWDPHGMHLAGLVTSYLVSVLVLTLKYRPGSKVPLLSLISVKMSIFGSFFLFLLVTVPSYSRKVLLLSLVLAVIFVVLSVSLRRSLRIPALSVVALALGFAVFGSSIVERSPELKVKVIATVLYNVKATFHSGYFSSEASAGGLATFGDDYLLATGDGELHLFSWKSDNNPLVAEPLPYGVPLNRDAFLSSAGDQVNTHWFRVADILVQKLENDSFRLFASHHYWKPEAECFVVRLSVTTGNYATVLEEEPQVWQTLYETEPCLPMKTRGHVFAGMQMGGRLVLLDDQRLLFSLGDHGFDGVSAEEMVSQDAQSSYGKTVLINLADGSSEVYSLGHRNPQGLYVAPSGTIWLTEHGPEGGDELNLIVEGANYGWPLVTYGSQSGKMDWPLNVSQGEHEGFERPFFSWLPAIGVSNVIGVEKELFGLWQGDLVVSSLNGRTLWRMRIREGRTAYVEPIEIGERVRDIIEDNDGRIVLWTEVSIVFVEPLTTAAAANLSISLQGELLFAECSGCHPAEDGTAHGIGPDLWGVAGRAIARAPNYQYSEALESLTGVWSEERLSAFLADPQTWAPGTTMQSGQLSDPADRAKLIEYLKTLR